MTSAVEAALNLVKQNEEYLARAYARLRAAKEDVRALTEVLERSKTYYQEQCNRHR